jgi:hypothetical protein
MSHREAVGGDDEVEGSNDERDTSYGVDERRCRREKARETRPGMTRKVEQVEEEGEDEWGTRPSVTTTNADKRGARLHRRTSTERLERRSRGRTTLPRTPPQPPPSSPPSPPAPIPPITTIPRTTRRRRRHHEVEQNAGTKTCRRRARPRRRDEETPERTARGGVR